MRSLCCKCIFRNKLYISDMPALLRFKCLHAGISTKEEAGKSQRNSRGN